MFIFGNMGLEYGNEKRVYTPFDVVLAFFVSVLIVLKFVGEYGKDAYQKRIDAAFEELFDGLKQVFPSASKDNDTLYSAVLDFSIVHQETYTAMGFLAGLRFCTDLRKACCSVGGSKIQSAIKKAVLEPDGSVTVEMGDGSRFEIRRREDA